MDSVFLQFHEALSRCQDLGGQLRNSGFAVVDDLFDQELLGALRDELEFLDNSMWLEPSGNKLQHADCEVGGTIVNKPGVFERSIFMKGELVAGESTMSIIPQISELYYQKERLAQCLADNSKLAVTGLDQVKLACIRPGGAFMVHTDTTPQKDRILTMTLYLNSSQSEYDSEADGGQLRLYPLSSQCVPGVVDVNPVYGRAVIFSSNGLPHRVLPSRSECRYCISFFFYGTPLEPSTSVAPVDLTAFLSPPPSAEDSNAIHEMFKAKFQGNVGKIIPHVLEIRKTYADVLCGLIYTEEYYKSLAEAFTKEQYSITTTGDNEEDAFQCLADNVPMDDKVVRGALEFLRHQCHKLSGSIDVDLSDFVAAARKYVRSDAFKTITVA